jgi:hypothetical protein
MTVRNNSRRANPEKLNYAHKIKYGLRFSGITSLNKRQTLRDELRKVQNSVAVLERQRNPGAGYWSSRPEVTDSRSSISSIPDAPSSSSPPLARNEEEVSYEYLRNVILQFLERKEMRVSARDHLIQHLSDKPS